MHFRDGVCNVWMAHVATDHVSNAWEAGRGPGQGSGNQPPGQEGPNRTPAPTGPSGAYTMSEVYLAGTEAEERDDLVWKEILHEGKWDLTPDGLTGLPVERPMEVVLSGTDVNEDHVVVGMQDVIDAFDEGAIPHVTVPVQTDALSEHGNKTMQNTGFVRKLEIRDRADGKKALYAGHEFTEPDVGEKVLRGTIPDTSAGLLFGYREKKTGKEFPVVLEHNALTHKPWIAGMEPFGVFASENRDNLDVTSLALGSEPPTETNDASGENGGTGEPAAPAAGAGSTGSRARHRSPTESDKLRAAQSRRDLQLAREDDDTPRGGDGMAEDGSNGNGEGTALEGLELSEEVRERVENQLSERDERINKLEGEVRDRRVHDTIERYKKMGLGEWPGFLKKVRALMLSDDGGTALLLSEERDGETVKERATVSQVVEQLVSSIPKDEDTGKIKFGDQLLGSVSLAEETKPKEDEDEATQDEKSEAAADFLGMSLPESKSAGKAKAPSKKDDGKEGGE